MNKWLLLLIVVGLVVAGYLNREQLTALLASHGVNVPFIPPPSTPVPTPNPAAASIARVKKAYPALSKEGSAFNKKFVALYNSLKETDPALLARDDWPVELANRTAHELGGGAMPIPGSTPPPVMHPLGGTLLDKKPKGGWTPPPGGSTLDQPAHQSH